MNRNFFALAACVAAVSLCTTAAVAALPGPAGFSFAKGAKFTVAGYAAGKPALSGFPVLVRLQANAPVGFSYADLQNSATDADLCFVDMDGNGLPFEIDTWDPAGESLVWVRLPTMTNGAEFVMCWGSSSSGKAVCGDNPWSGYAGVWHLGETGAGGTSANSSSVSISKATDNDLAWAFGNDSDRNDNTWKGSIDEVRLRGFVPTADWIAADYATQTSASFLTAGAAEAYGELVDRGSATTLPASGLSEIYVDSLGSGNGSSPESALPTIREALDIAGPGFTIWVRGGEDRSYVVSNETDTLRISAELEGLSIRAYGETPGDGGRAAFSVSPSYIDDGNRIHIVSNAATDVTLAGFTCSYGPRSLGVQDKGSVLLIAVAAPRFTIADCEFFCTGIPGYSGSGANGIVAAINVNDNWHVATGMLVERCFFHDTTGYRGDIGTYPLRVATRTTIRECVFSNAWRIAADPGPGKTKFRDFTFVSNVVHSGPMRDASYFSFPHGLFSSGWGGLGGGAEIAYNVFVGTGEPNRGILALARWDGLGGSERFHHNVVRNYGWVWGFNRGDNAPTGKTVAEIFDNVFDLMDGGTIVRDEGFDGETPRVGTPIFHTGSFSRNNAIVASGAFWGGASALAEDYDRSVVSPLDDIAIDEPPDWVCTNDLFHADFYRYRTSRTATPDLGVLAWRGENNEYPLWIGAKPPLYPSATMLILR